MAFLHCHGLLKDGTRCGWEQDDFWKLKSEYNPKSEGYTPLRSDIIEYLRESLFKDKVYMDAEYFIEHLYDLPSQLDDKGKPYCKGTDYVVHDLRHRANRIDNMLVKTCDEWKQVQNTIKCPRCGGTDWDID